MKLLLSKNLILGLVVVAAMTAGTVLLAGYVDGSGQGPQVAADCKCADCQCADCDGNCEGCASACENCTCDAKPACSGCPEKAQPAPACGTGCQTQVQGRCGAGGCCPMK
ncbi:MAG: hypothetical protein ABFE01_18960 [Phycisphaerales bacterium]|jgi:hypothetical protein